MPILHRIKWPKRPAWAFALLLGFSLGDPLPTTPLQPFFPSFGFFLEEWDRGGQGSLSPQERENLMREGLKIGSLLAERVNRQQWSDSELTEFAFYLAWKSGEFRLSPLLLLSIIEVESSFEPRAVSSRGARGLLQLMPNTAEELAQSYGLPWNGPESLYDPKFSLELGLRYMRRLQNRFDRQEHVLEAYNMGPTALRRKLENGDPLALVYSRKVLRNMRALEIEAKELPQRTSPSWL
jgi:hypothetical protein